MTIYKQANWEPGQSEEKLKLVPVPEDKFQTLPRENPDQAFILGSTIRPGFAAFIQEVEYTMYTPDGPKNVELELMTSEFPKGSDIIWFTMIIPIVDLDKVREVAKRYNFSFKQSSIPAFVDEKGLHPFPLEANSNVYSVSGHLDNEELVKKYTDHWHDVIEKHAKGLPWDPL
jgi:hypothetical protein